MNEPLGTDVPEGFIRLKCKVSYDGTDFSGWGMQPGLRTVQGVLEDALAEIFRVERIVIQCAGRTDAGVHATGQVFHCDVPEKNFPSVDMIRYRFSRILDPDVVVTAVELAPEHFDARFGAVSRTYEYRINDGIGKPLLRRFVYHHGWELDLDLMNQASQRLLGLHDFTSYCKPKDFGTTIRTLQKFEWRRNDEGIIIATLKADAFCYSMVRMLVGALLDVGRGKRPVEWVSEYLDGKERETGVFVVPAHGLTFVNVEYAPDAQLAAQVAKTKRTRIEGDPES